MRWSSQIPTKFHVFRGTRDAASVLKVFDYGAITLFRQTFQTVNLTSHNHISRSHDPSFKLINKV